MRILAAFALCTAWASPAAASGANMGPGDGDPGPSIGTVPLDVDQSVDDRMRESLESGLSSGLSRGSVTITPLEGVDSGCDGDCQESAGSNAGVTHVVSGRVFKEGPDYKLVLSAREVGSTRAPIVLEDVCEICGESELGERIADLSATLETRIEDAVSRVATLELRGSPEDAIVYVDGQEIGPAPVELRFDPGTHEIEIRKKGFTTQRQTWKATEGVSDQITFDLQRAKKKRRGKHHVIRPLGFALSGVGVGLISSGAVLIGINGNEHQNTCTDDLVDIDGDCPFRYATKGPGIGLVVGGVLAAAGGAGLLTWSYMSDGKREAEARLDVGPRSVMATLRF
jgi:hypothetical protein